MSKTTLEDWNTWNYLFNDLYSPLVIDCEQDVGDYGVYEILSKDTDITILSKCDLDRKNQYSVYPFRITPNGGVSRNAAVINDGIFSVPYVADSTYVVPLKSDIPTLSYGAGAVLPYYSKYYLFRDDGGDSRLYRLNKVIPAGVTINDLHDTVISENGKKYCNFNTVVDDKYLKYLEAGVDLSNAFLDIYSPPLWEITEPFYIGCTNTISDKLTSDVDLTTYINNKEETEYYIPLDYNKDYLNVRLTSKSQSPYLAMNVTTQIPVITKEIINVGDLGKYEYSKLANNFFEQIGVTFESQINTRLDLNNYAIQGMDFNIENELILENGWIMQAKIINNGVLTVQNAVLSQGTIINNGTLTLSASDLYYINIVNNGKLIIKDCDEIIISDMDKDMPFIHNTGAYTIINNNIECRGEFDDNSLIFIRSENVDNILENNNFTYHITFDNYRIDGNGFIYSNIDDDTIILKNLTSEEVE